MQLPATHFIELTEKVDKINKSEELRAELIEGAIYYQINVPTKAKEVPTEYTASVNPTSAKVTFTFNKLGGYEVFGEGEDAVTYQEVLPAVEGAYSVSLYYVNSKNKLVKLGTSAPTINVANSTPAVKAEGFKETNVYEGDATTAEDILKEIYNFSWNGELLYDEDREVEDSANFWIKSAVIDPTSDENKLIVTEIEFAIGYFNSCVADGEGGVTNNAAEFYQTYTMKKRITIKLD